MNRLERLRKSISNMNPEELTTKIREIRMDRVARKVPLKQAKGPRTAKSKPRSIDKIFALLMEMSPGDRTAYIRDHMTVAERQAMAELVGDAA